MFNFLKTKPKEIKFCRDCKWIDHNKNVSEKYSIEYSKCNNPKLVKMDLVTGSFESNYCSTERNFSCGKDAKYFEPKEI